LDQKETGTRGGLIKKQKNPKSLIEIQDQENNLTPEKKKKKKGIDFDPETRRNFTKEGKSDERD